MMLACPREHTIHSFIHFFVVMSQARATFAEHFFRGVFENFKIHVYEFWVRIL